MIRVTIERDGHRLITGFKVTGHAGYDEAGQDIVCAGVSAVTVGAVNSLETLLDFQVDAQMSGGFLQAGIPHAEPSVRDKAQLILESMLVMLKTIEASYGEYVTIQDGNKGGGTSC